jgi:chromate reductase
MEVIRLLALSGSLRGKSYNTAAILALQALAPEHVEIKIGNIASLPLFNPDREDEALKAVVALKSAVNDCDGLIIASPEYAHGVSGPLKNALDWLVSGAEFPYKPVMLVNTSPRAHHAMDSLCEILATMSANLVQESYVAIPLLGSNLDSTGILANTAISGALKNGLIRFCDGIKEKPGSAHDSF